MDAEYEQKQNDYVKEIIPKLKEQAYVETKAATERFNTIAMYSFIAFVIVLVLILIKKNVTTKKKAEMEAAKKAIEEKKKSDAAEKRNAEEAAAERKAQEQRDAEFKLLTIKHHEYLKASNGSKDSCIDYFMEKYPDRPLDMVLEYQAYLRAVEWYENPSGVKVE